ncbi:23S rRNA pseudouridine(955/2504/2580) synthase RluC [Endothiovibrio diazotrophicus]
MNEPSPPAAAVRFAVIAPEEAGQRIDNYLLRQLKGVPKSRVYRILRKGEVRVNKKRVAPEYRLEEGDSVRIPPVRVAAGKEGAPLFAAKRIEQSVIYEDKGLLVVDKPAGMAVHGGSGVSHGVIEALRASRPDAPFLELVHRLDRDTSGCLMIAKKRSMLRTLHELLRGDGVDKRYLALVAGRVKGEVVDAQFSLRKNTLRGGERVVKVAPDGKPAHTRFRVVERYRGATLVEAELFTGRTHQIRVHAATLGHPLAGDPKYGDEAFNRYVAERGLKRLFLHARSLAVKLPEGEEIIVSTPLPEELEALLQRLERKG